MSLAAVLLRVFLLLTLTGGLLLSVVAARVQERQRSRLPRLGDDTAIDLPEH